MASTETLVGIPPIQLHHRLAIAQEWAGVKRAELAALLGVSGNTISNYTNGNTTPSVAVLRVWALRCGVPFDWLATGDSPYGPDDDPAGEQDVETTGCNLQPVVVPLRRAA